MVGGRRGRRGVLESAVNGRVGTCRVESMIFLARFGRNGRTGAEMEIIGRS
jgi:hypothetical protein